MTLIYLECSSWWSTDELNDFGLPTERSKWFSAPTIVNAFYMPEFNSITFPAGILQPPFYRANSLQALNYGGIGQVRGDTDELVFSTLGLISR